MSFCIPKPIAKKLRAAAVRGEVNIKELYDMESSADRRAFFEEYTDEETARGINAGFEKAMSPKYKLSLIDWVNVAIKGKDIKVKRKNLLDKVNKLSDDELLTPSARGAFMEDLVGDVLGAKVNVEEIKQIDTLSKELRKQEAKGLDKFGNYQLDYWKARRKMDNYLFKIDPSSRVKVTTSVIRRGFMLLSIKSPIVNIIGNTTIGLEQSAERRVRVGEKRGAVSQELIKEYRKSAVSVFNKTGYDVTRMQDIGEGRKTLGEKITHSQGKGTIRKLGRVMEDIVFSKMLGTPDVWFSAFAHADSANLQATAKAKAEGLEGKALEKRATELFLDATSVSPTSDPGNRIRTQAIADAQFATFTNEGSLATAALNARGFLNAVHEDLAIGDQTIPFVKTPANAIEFSFDSGGVSFARGLRNFPAAKKQLELGDPSLMRDVYADMFRSGFGIMGALLLVSLFDPEDFIGMYPTSSKERELLKLKGATPNSIKIGDKYYSLDYFGGHRGSLVGIMNAKKYGGNIIETLYNFARGNVAQLSDLPGLDAVVDAINFVNDAAPEGRLDTTELVSRTKVLISDYSKSLVIPAISNDLAKAFDASERQVDWKKPGDRWKASIPFIRRTLPEKLDVFGEVLKGEPWYSAILFGARVRTARDSEIIDEIRRLDESGNLPTLTRPEWSSSRVKLFKTQVSEEKFNKAMTFFRNEYKKNVQKEIKRSSYKKKSDEEKKKEIDSIKAASLNKMLKKFRFKKKKK